MVVFSPWRDVVVGKPPDNSTRYVSSLEATRRSFNKDFLLALAADFKKHGAAAIEKVRKTQPAVYMKICALVPREMKVEHAGTIKQMSDEQIEEAIAAIKAMLAARAGETAKVIEGGQKSSRACRRLQGPRRHREVVALVRFLQKSLNLSGAISVYLTVCWMFLWPR